MQRYFETLFRRKELFLIPMIIVPIITVAMTVLTGRQYEVIAAVWVEPGVILQNSSIQGLSRSRRPNEVVVQAMTDRLKTENVRAEVLQRAGLATMIDEGEWPNPTDLQLRLNNNPYLIYVAKALGMALPQTKEEAENMALNMILESLRISKGTESSDNLIVIKYTGSEPKLGQRLVEETINLYRETTLTLLIDESALGVEFFTRNLDQQSVRLSEASQNLQRFLETNPEPLLGQKRPPEEDAELQKLVRNLRLEQTLYEAAINKLEDVRLAGEAAIASHNRNIQVLDPPEAPDEEVGIGIRKLGMMSLMGITLGLMLGVVGVVVVTWRDDTVWTRADIERSMGVTGVAEVPLIRVSNKKRRQYLMKLATGLATSFRPGN